MYGIIALDKDGRVTQIGDVLHDTRPVTRERKLKVSLANSGILTQNHGIVAKELKEKFNFDREQKRNNWLIMELNKAFTVIDDFKKAKEEVEKRKLIGDSILKNFYDGHEDYTHLSKETIESVEEKQKENLERMAFFKGWYEENMPVLEANAKTMKEQASIALFEAMELLETKSMEQQS